MWECPEKAPCRNVWLKWLVSHHHFLSANGEAMCWCHLIMRACCLAYIYWLVLKREDVYDESWITAEVFQLIDWRSQQRAQRFSFLWSAVLQLSWCPKWEMKNECYTHATIYGIRGMFFQAQLWITMTLLTSQYMECNLTWLRVVCNPSDEFTVTSNNAVIQLIYKLCGQKLAWVFFILQIIAIPFIFYVTEVSGKVFLFCPLLF